jgi:putative peptide zinc metalloprotease protein
MLDISLVVQQQLAEALTQLEGLVRKQEQLNITAPYSATVIQWDDEVQPGRWINDRLRLGLLVDKASAAIQGYVKEQNLARLSIGNDGRFFADEVDLPPLSVQLTAIDKVNADSLVEPYLASVYDGPVAVNQADNGELVSITSLYRLHLTLLDSSLVPLQIIRGTVVLDGKPESLLHRIWLFVSAVLVRESGF